MKASHSLKAPPYSQPRLNLFWLYLNNGGIGHEGIFKTAETTQSFSIEKLGIWASTANLDSWDRLVDRQQNTSVSVRIGIVGKYVDFQDTYKSLNEALTHGGVANRARVELVYIDSEELDPRNPDPVLANLDAILVPGGFGNRGAEGKIAAVRYARTNKVPFFGICLGLQVAVIEFSRNVLGLAANSREFDENAEHLVIELMLSWKCKVPTA